MTGQSTSRYRGDAVKACRSQCLDSHRHGMNLTCIDRLGDKQPSDQTTDDTKQDSHTGMRPPAYTAFNRWGIYDWYAQVCMQSAAANLYASTIGHRHSEQVSQPLSYNQ